MNQKRNFPLFIIDNSRSHGRGREKDFVACTSRELPWVGEITILNERELEIDQDWQKRSWWCAYTDDNGAGLRGKLKMVSTPVIINNSNRVELQALMHRCLKEWRIRRGTVAVDLESISNEAVVKFADTLLEQTRENLRENPKDSQIATTIEQSKHLLELGLKAETADMYWERGYLDTHQESDDELRELTEPIDFNEHLLSLVPAWSFGALYLLLYRCGGTATDAPHLCEDVPGQGWYFHCYGMNYETISFPTMVEAAYDYVVWLLENKHYRFDNEWYIRKNKED